MDLPQTPRERCDPVEYAELKDLAQADLADAYCYASGLAVRRSQEAKVAGDMATAGSTAGWLNTKRAFERYAAQCTEQTKRINDLYGRRFGGSPIACPSPK